MKTNFIFLLLTLILSGILFGCTTQGPINQTDRIYFDLNKEFSLSQGQIASGPNNIIEINLLEITDSTCPKDVQCVWAGELGAKISVSQVVNCPPGALCKMSPPSQEFDLGLTTLPVVTFFDKQVTLIGVNKDANKVQLIVETYIEPKINEDQVWFSISPKQCNSNSWNEWQTKTGIKIKKSPDVSLDEALIPIWLKETEGIIVHEVKAKITSEMVCEACSCPTGEQVAVLVDSNVTSKMSSLGFSLLSPVACTMDAKICPGGSPVGRTAPFCEFETCPLVDCPIYSPPYCPDGTITSEIDSKGCPVPICTPDLNVLIELTEFPGFVMNPTTKKITIDLYGLYTTEVNSRTWNNDTNEWDESNSSESYMLDKNDFTALVGFIENTSFFTFDQNNLNACIADIPEKSLNISIGKKSNSLYGIGAECDKNKTTELYVIIDKIDSFGLSD